MTKFKFLGFASEISGVREKKIKLTKPKSLKEIFKVKFSEDRFILLINQKPANFNDLIENEDEVLVMPVVSGG
ncbi:MAG: MoaD/ThiS family protein [Candidatus Methanofastidiosia archaeon]